MKKWKCEICGYVAEGEMAPEVCKVCGAGAEVFVETDGSLDGDNKNWLCLFCGFIYEAETMPEMCPECHAKGHNIFVEYDANKDQMNAAGNMFRCNSCRLVTFADENPGECPACGASAFISKDDWLKQRG